MYILPRINLIISSKRKKKKKQSLSKKYDFQCEEDKLKLSKDIIGNPLWDVQVEWVNYQQNELSLVQRIYALKSLVIS